MEHRGEGNASFNIWLPLFAFLRERPAETVQSDSVRTGEVKSAEVLGRSARRHTSEHP